MHPSKITIPLFLTLTLVSAFGCTKPGIPVYPDYIQSVEKITTPTQFTLDNGTYGTTINVVSYYGHAKIKDSGFKIINIEKNSNSTIFKSEFFETKCDTLSLSKCKISRDQDNNITYFEIYFPRLNDKGIHLDNTNKIFKTASAIFQGDLRLPTHKKIVSGDTLFNYGASIYADCEIIKHEYSSKLVGYTFINGHKIIITSVDEKNMVFKSKAGEVYEIQDVVGFELYDAETLFLLYSELVITSKEIKEDNTFYMSRRIESEAFSKIREGKKVQ